MKKIELCIDDETYEKLLQTMQKNSGAFIESDGSWCLEVHIISGGYPDQLTYRIGKHEVELGDVTVNWDH